MNTNAVLAKTSVVVVADATEPCLWAVLVAGRGQAHEELALSLQSILVGEEATEGAESTYVAREPECVLWASWWTWFLLFLA